MCANLVYDACRHFDNSQLIQKDKVPSPSFAGQHWMASPSHPWLTSQPPSDQVPSCLRDRKLNFFPPPTFTIKDFPVDAREYSKRIIPLPPSLLLAKKNKEK